MSEDEVDRPEPIEATIVEDENPFTFEMLRIETLGKAREILNKIEVNNKETRKEAEGLSGAFGQLVNAAIQLELLVNDQEAIRQQVREELIAKARESKKAKKAKKN